MAKPRYAPYQILRVPASIVRIDPVCEHPHPFLVIEVSSTGAYAMFVSTQVDTFFNESRDFFITAEEDGCQTTGLDAPRCFVKNQEFFIDDTHHLEVMGYLSGELLERFKAFARRFDL